MAFKVSFQKTVVAHLALTRTFIPPPLRFKEHPGKENKREKSVVRGAGKACELYSKHDVATGIMTRLQLPTPGLQETEPLNH